VTWKSDRRAELTERDGRPFHPSAPHGTNSAYTNYGCRCDRCRAAHIAQDVDLRRRQAAEVAPSGVHPYATHGTANGYSYYGCRCEPCTAAATEQRRLYPHKPKKK
jgi:hypothetical protein